MLVPRILSCKRPPHALRLKVTLGEIGNRSVIETTLCVKCFSAYKLKENVCPSCGEVNVFLGKQDLLEQGRNAYFYGFQNRTWVEGNIEKYGKEIRVEAMQLQPHEILAWISLAALSGVTWDGIKYILVKIKDKAIENMGNKDLEIPQSDLESSYEHEINSLLENDEEVQRFCAYVDQYRKDFANESVDDQVKEDTVFLEKEIVTRNSDTLKALRISIENSRKNVDKKA